MRRLIYLLAILLMLPVAVAQESEQHAADSVPGSDASPRNERLTRRPPHQRDLTGQPWVDMDYGPYLSASIEATAGNIAQKGIAVRVDEGLGGLSAGSEFLLFETDTLRCAAGWFGAGCLDWRGIAYNGEHGIHPSLVGHVLFSNPAGPGWARPGTEEFEDQRLLGRDGRRYGPLDRSWAHWQGLYRDGNDVILSYRVGDAQVLEMPAATPRSELPMLTRTFQVGSRSQELMLQVAHDANGDVELHRPPGQNSRPLVSFLSPGEQGRADIEDDGEVEGDDDVNDDEIDEREFDESGDEVLGPWSDAPYTVCGVAGTTDGMEWKIDEDGNVRLLIPAGDEPLRFVVTYAKATDREKLDQQFAAVVTAAPPTDLKALCSGGDPLWDLEFKTAIEPFGPIDGPLVVDDLKLPEDNLFRSWMRLGGFDFFADGNKAAVCTWQGDVWLVTGLAHQEGTLSWRRIAAGMFQPLGLKIVDGDIYVTCRDQITVLRDLNGDEEIDFYENFNNDAQVTEHFHEFAMGLETDAEGNFYYCKAARHARDALVPQHGTLLRVSKDGKSTEILASGFRAPNGICVNGDGTFLVSDQEGHWTPKNRINLVRPGGFYGNLMGYHEGKTPQDVLPPITWIHNNFDRSPAEQVQVTGSQWGPLEGRTLNLSYGTGRIHLLLQEQVDEVTQGGVVNLPIPQLPTGVMRGRFHRSDGQLYACGLFGWSSDRTAPGGFYRIRATGQPFNLPVDMHVKKNALVITFSDRLDPESAASERNYAAAQWNYRATSDYGSDDFRVSNRRRRGRDRLRIESASVSSDGRTITLGIPRLRPAMQMELQYSIRSADGVDLSQKIHHTVHVLGD